MPSSPYTNVRPFVTTLPSWVGNNADAERISAYSVYEDIFWSSTDTFKLVMRGTDVGPIYIPSGRVIVEATNRFLAQGWDFAVSPRMGTPADQEITQTLMTNLFRREALWTKFATQKRYGLIRGDVVWHIVADDTKPLGRRISVYEVDPGRFFPIVDPINPEKFHGVHLVSQAVLEKKAVNFRQTYRRDPVTGTITSESGYFELGKWDDRIDPSTGEQRIAKQVAVVQPPTPLPPQITSLPVYHVKNNRIPDFTFGASEMRGLETLMLAVNQSITDEDLSLALQGLGLYWTTSGPPTDEDGNETNWRLGPGRVVEVDVESTFNRVKGIEDVSPWLDHMRFILDNGMQAAGVPDIAAGNVDVTTAESGIALSLKLSPLLAKNAEKEQEMMSKYDQMLYDFVHMWLPAYEGTDAATEVEVVGIVDDPMPVNRDARIQELISLVTSVPPIISAEYARQELTKLGYEFPAEMGEAIVAEQAKFTATQYPDPYTGRVAGELLDGGTK